MSRGSHIFFYIGGALLAIVFPYLTVQSLYAGSTRILFIPPAMLAGIVAFIQPLLGTYLVLLLSPIKTSGQGILLVARLLGVVVVISLLIRSSIRREPIRWSGTEGPVILIGLGMSLSFFRTSNIASVADSLLSLISLYALLLVIINVIEDNNHLKKVVLVFLASGIYPIIQAIIQGLHPNPERTFSRVSGTFSLPTGLGGFLIPLVLLAAALLFYQGSSYLTRIFILGIFVGGIVALFLTLSRGAIIGVAIGFAFLFRLLRSQVISRSLNIVIIIITIIVAGWSLWPSLQGRVFTPILDFLVGRPTSMTITTRSDEMSVLVPITLDNHFMGTGIGNYERAAWRYQVIYNVPDLPTTPHNIFLYFFGEVGFIAALGFIWLVVWLVRNIISSWPKINSSSHDIEYYVYLGAICGLIGYIPFMITHSGIFTNETWIITSLVLVSSRFSRVVFEATPDGARFFL